MRRCPSRTSAALLILLLLPSAAYAQAAITGVVKDTSGAVLPGVTVEAASPALIEKVRLVVSDGTGQYRIVNLVPGTYAVTFTLPGFNTVKREGIQLAGEFVATVNADLRVGALEETITVTGETPIVDIQSARTQQTLGKDVISTIPSSRLVGSIVRLIPGMNLNTDVGGSTGVGSTGSGNIHGGRNNDSRLLNDGLSTAYNGGGGGMFMANAGGAQEVVVSTSGGLGENEVGGVVINVIPRDGANTFSGSVFGAFANGAMQGSNYTQELQEEGLTSPNEIVRVYDINPMGGGRIIRDRLWFYNTFRAIRGDNTVAGMFHNKNAGDITKWTYEPDLTKPAIFDNIWGSFITRLTWQATPRNKIAAYWDEQWKCLACSGGGTVTGSPEGSGRAFNHPSRFQQASWTSPLTSRVLLEASYGQFMMTYRGSQPRLGFNTQLIRVVEQGGSIPGLAYRAPASYSHSLTNTRTWRASMSYVTGAHNMKFGYFGGFQDPLNASYWFVDPLITQYRFRDGVPNQFTIFAANPSRNHRNLVPTSLYAQDQWTRGRLTLQGGLRYDHYTTSYPEFRMGGNSAVPELFVFPAGSVTGLRYDDVTPRMGVAYDLFGTGRTAVKFNLGKYPLAQAGSGDDSLLLGPFDRLAPSTTRSWTDTNKNYVPDCDLVNPAKNGECGAYANQNFGKAVFSRNFDPAVTEGWSTRAYQWEMGASVQQELIPRVSATVGYYRRWYGNFYTTDNRAVGLSDFDQFSITAPVDARLPGGGGHTIDGLYDVRPDKFGLVDSFVVASKTFGKQIERWHGVDVGVNARMQNGVTVQGGISTGRRLTDNCEIRAQLPEIDPTNPYCRVEEPFLLQMRGLASYTIPRVDIQLSGTFQNDPGPVLEANYNAPNSIVAQSLGRNLAGGENNIPVNLIAPATLYADRLSYIDFRVAKILRFGRTRTQIGLDLYNATNTSVPQAYNQTYVPGGRWLTPQNILPARFAKVSAQFDF